MIIIGLDPGTGRSSPTGIFIFDEEDGMILYAGNFYPLRNKEHSSLTEHLRLTLPCILGHRPKSDILIAIETFVMRGKAGQMLQRLIGAALSDLEMRGHIVEVYNTTVKKLIGGTGKADKEQVANGVLEYFTERAISEEYIKNLIKNKNWDTLDAAAIALAGLHEKTKEKSSFSTESSKASNR
jgi:Holliday junction resolvasome RuvABC endonuclease subunit